MAQSTLATLTGALGDAVFLGVGHGYPWSSNDTLIPPPVNTIDNLNQLHRDLVALKKLSISSASLVIQRNDWVANTLYDAFHENLEMYTYVDVIPAVGTVNVSNSNILVGTNTTFTVNFVTGDIINLNGDGIFTLPVQKEIISIQSANTLTVNSNVIGNYINSSIENYANNYPNYAYNFYVRNIYDQVFICLDNNNNAASTQMPLISIGGQIPSDAYVITDDGYKWKYLYTMSAGAKKLFFTEQWMPVGSDPLVTGSAVDGRIDIIDILAGGTKYNGNVAACNAPILTLTGDGTGANLSAQVDSNGSIFAVNLFDAGHGYTTATIAANTGANGSGALFNISIGPPGGWGSNAALELGATTLMISTTLNDTENGTIPTEDIIGEFFAYRQISLILNPTLHGSGNVATNTNYDMTVVIQTSSETPVFKMGDTAYQNQLGSGTLANATFFGTVVWYDSASQELHLNNIGGTGTFTEGAPISVVSFGAPANTAPYSLATAFQMTPPEVNTFSGQDLYIENVAPIQRYPLQQEEVRLIIQF